MAQTHGHCTEEARAVRLGFDAEPVPYSGEYIQCPLGSWSWDEVFFAGVGFDRPGNNLQQRLMLQSDAPRSCAFFLTKETPNPYWLVKYNLPVYPP